jgi:hypothetical protein
LLIAGEPRLGLLAAVAAAVVELLLWIRVVGVWQGPE